MSPSNKSNIEFITDFGIKYISTGVEKSLDLARHVAFVFLGKRDIPTIFDKSYEVANHWTYFGIYLAKHIVEPFWNTMSMNVDPKRIENKQRFLNKEQGEMVKSGPISLIP